MSEQKSQQIPSVGRVVHYVAYGTPGGEFEAGAHRAAIITEVFFETVGGVDPTVASLCVLNPTGMFFKERLVFDPTGTIPGTWHWPEYVPEK
jgi:hypothetical protein